MIVPASDDLWDVKTIADFLVKSPQWVYRSAEEHGLVLFDIGGKNLRAVRSDVIRWSVRNADDPEAVAGKLLAV